MIPDDRRRAWLEAAMRAVPWKHDAICLAQPPGDVCEGGGECEPDYPAVAAVLDAPLRELEEALEPFGSGRDWGLVKAFLVHGPATKEEGIQLAKGLTKIQVAADAALARLPWRAEPQP